MKKFFNELRTALFKVCPEKLFRILKLTNLLLLVTIFNVFGSETYSQYARLNLDMKDVPIQTVLSAIEEQSEFFFLFNNSKTTDVTRKVDIHADNRNLTEVMDELLAGTVIRYAVKDRQILLVNKETESAESLQQQVVTGTVTDAATGETLPGVTVVIKGTTLGTLTDLNGKFTISLPESSAVLSISFIGYTSQDIRVSQGAAIRVLMVTELQQIDEVIVVGYGAQKKESVVGAITQVDNQTIMKSGSPNVTNAISGKLSGVLTIQQTGEPGKNQSEIIVRGLSSWSGSAPLILIDGVERDFQEMDPNEISTISVLKDASATAVFGAKGANGVIIVTTKRGSLGKAQLTFTGSTGAQVPTRLPSFIDSYTTKSMMNVAFMNSQQFTKLTSQNILNEFRNPSTPLKALQYPNVDWFDVNAKTFAPTSNANISVVGGTDFVKYFSSIGYLYEGSIFKQPKEGYSDSRYWYNRFNFRTNLDFSLTKTTLLSLNVGGDVGIRNSTTQSYWGDWSSFYGTSGAEVPAFWPAWVLEQIPDTDYPDATGIRQAATFSSWFTNPYSNINKGSFERQMVTQLYTDLILDQKLNYILKGLSAKGKVSFNTSYTNRSLYADYTVPQYKISWDRVGVDANGDGKIDQNPWQRDGEGLEYYYPAPLNVNVGGMEVSTAGLGDAKIPAAFYTNLYYEMSLNYNNSFGMHNITGLALMNREQKNLGSEFPYYNAAFVGRATYDYSHKYLVEINIGYTGSERFAPGNRYGFFPSGAVGWVISQENFFKDAVPWMNKLKIRYSDGLVGSDYAANRWLYMSDYYTDPRGYLHEDKGANVSAQWEESRKKDFGIEVGIFKSLFSFSIDLFDEQRDKMLLTPRSVTFLIGNSFKELNLGSLKKHGIELEVEFNKTTASNLNYYIKGNFGFNENRILFKDDPVYAPEYTKASGKPLGAMLTGAKFTGTGFMTSVDDIHINPSPLLAEKLYVGDYKFLDYNSDGQINTLDNFPIEGQTYAPVTYSLSSGFSYKGFDFNIMFQGNYGKYCSLGAVSIVEFYKATPRVHLAQLGYWRPDNQDAATFSTLHINEADGGDAIHTWGAQNWDGIFWRKSSYTRLKEIYAGYNLNSGFLNNLAGIHSILVYFNATNVLTFTKLLKEFDPEAKNPGTFYPQLSRYNLGLKFSF